MKRTILTGVVAMTAGLSGLMAQPKPKSNGERKAIVAIQSATEADAIIKALGSRLNQVRHRTMVATAAAKLAASLS